MEQWQIFALEAEEWEINYFIIETKSGAMAGCQKTEIQNTEYSIT